MRGARSKQKAEFQVNVQKQSVPNSSGASLAKNPNLDIKPDRSQSGQISAGVVSTGSTDS